MKKDQKSVGIYRGNGLGTCLEQHFKEKMGPTHNTTKEEWEVIRTLREDSSHVVLNAYKGVALVVMDKSQYINKCMALLNDTKVYKPCKDTTKKLHRDI